MRQEHLARSGSEQAVLPRILLFAVRAEEESEALHVQRRVHLVGRRVDRRAEVLERFVATVQVARAVDVEPALSAIAIGAEIEEVATRRNRDLSVVFRRVELSLGLHLAELRHGHERPGLVGDGFDDKQAAVDVVVGSVELFTQRRFPRVAFLVGHFALGPV